jgi:hypothetical protein
VAAEPTFELVGSGRVVEVPVAGDEVVCFVGFTGKRIRGANGRTLSTAAEN